MIRKILEKILIYKAQKAISKWQPFIIAVTGSVGKTTTREAIYAVLSSRYDVVKNEKNYNNLIGNCLTFLDLPVPTTLIKKIHLLFKLFFVSFKRRDFYVMEFGADTPGDIEILAKFFKPKISVVTAIGDVPVHVENYPSLESVAHEKSNLVRFTVADGTVYLNKDDPKVSKMSELTSAEKVFYGKGHIIENNLLFDEHGKIGRHIIVRLGGQNIEIKSYSVISNHQAMAFIPALLIGDKLGVSIDEMKLALENYNFPNGRMKLIQAKNDALLIDDTYNASPLSTKEALNTLSELKHMIIKQNPNLKVVAFLGEMKELGKYGPGEHYKIGQLAGEICDVLVSVGTDNASHMIRGFKSSSFGDGKDSYIFENSSEASEFAERNMGNTNFIVLVKGSQSMRMEYVVKKLMKDPQNASKLLVRQTSDWI